MTIAANKSAGTVSPASGARMVVNRAEESRRDRKIWLITIGIVAAIFLLLENPYWVPGGDSEVYISSARSIAMGNGYMFNGQAARIAPPGWPMVLAVVMKFISPTFLALKLMTLGCMLGALATYFWVLRRFAPPILCAAVIILTALISHVYSLTFWLHSDALFTLITALSLLLSLQISEGDRSTWKIIALLLLCVISAAVRYAGIINILIIGAALLQGHRRAPARAWITVALTISITIVSFYSVRWAVNYFAPKTVAFEALAQIDPSAILGDTQLTETGGTKAPDIFTGTRGRSGYVTRLLGYGTWFSYLLWQPMRLGTGSHAIWYVATALGWIVAL
ncbi:MAG: hypothetical protein H7Z14_11580, partial [Anaerolineae bacterium]|nr:hypothetical protein [Phycisphaerae bacterium]